jgi:PAS domain S-box-containing protein
MGVHQVRDEGAAAATGHVLRVARAALDGVDGDELWDMACAEVTSALRANWAVQADPTPSGGLTAHVGGLPEGTTVFDATGGSPHAAHVRSVPVDGSTLVVGWDDAPDPERSATVLATLAEVLGTGIRRARAEREVAENEARLAEAQEMARLGSYDWNITTDTNVWSDELYRIYGHEPGAFNASYERFISMIHPDDRERVQAVHAKAMQDHEPFRMEERIVRPDGEVRILDSSGKLVCDERGNPQRFVGICLDVTEARRAADALRESETRAAEATRRLEEAEQRRNQAAEINDNVVQGLATIVYALEEDQGEAALRAAHATLAAASAMMSDLLGEAGATLGSGELLRERPAPSVLGGLDRGPAAPQRRPEVAMRVLVADDCDDIRLLYRLILENRGITVVAEAVDGLEAVRLAEAERPDAALVDLAMPGLDGMQVTSEIKRLLPDCPVVVLSGFEASMAEEQALAAGADRYLCKGVDPEAIVAALIDLHRERAGSTRT